MSASKSSRRWMQEHREDPFVKKARAEGYRGRAVYKLIEMDEKEGLIKPGMSIVDLGAAPGSWSQYVAKQLKATGMLFALDKLAMESISGVTFIQGDFQEESIFQELLDKVPCKGVDLVLSDMAPNSSGLAVVDIPRAMYLAELAFDFAIRILKPGGSLLIKIFHGAGFDELIAQVRTQFNKVYIRKPAASRSRSRESYLLAKGYNL